MSPHVRAGATLAAAVGLAATLVLAGPRLIEPMVAGLSAAMVETVFTLVLFGAMLVIGAGAAWLCGGNALAPGKTGVVPVGLGAGVIGMSIAAGYAAVAGTLQPGQAGGGSAALILWGAAMVLVQAGAEEVWFRGWLQPALARGWGVVPAILVAALAFTLLHVAGGARGPLTLLNLLLGGLLFGLLAARGQGIASAVAAHWGWNATEQLGFGLDPNPGLGSFGAVANYDLIGAAAWGGSAEGLNASLAMTFALLAMLVPLALLWWRDLASGMPAASAVRVPSAG